jgi:hypothetical protein
MNTKMLIIIVGVVIVSGAGYLYFMQQSQQAAVTNGTPPASGMQGKINIDEICQGALAYMTFESSVEAEAFMQDCMEGKRPEVIEKWKADNNISSDTAI